MIFSSNRPDSSLNFLPAFSIQKDIEFSIAFDKQREIKKLIDFNLGYIFSVKIYDH